MPRLFDMRSADIKSNYSFSPIKPFYEPKVPKVTDLTSMMGRLRDYSDGMFLLKKCLMGVSQRGWIPLERFCQQIEYFIENAIDGDPYKEIVQELNRILRGKKTITINTKHLFKKSYFINISDIIDAAEQYIKSIHGNDQIHQKEKFYKILCSIRIIYAVVMSEYVSRIRSKIMDKAGDENVWMDAYEIGYLQGEMGLLASHLDKEIIKIHHSSRASEKKSEDHESRRELRAQEELLQDQRLQKYLKQAEEEWNKKKEKIYHSAMADRLIEKYPELKGDRDILVEKLKPISRKYRFSDFCEGEFRKRTTIISLCQSLNNDRYGIRLTSPDNTIDRLNEVVRTPDFYSKWLRKKRTVNLLSEAADLVAETQAYRDKKFSDMTEDEQTKIKRMNRLLLEHTYPMTPKSLENGLMRGWKGKKS